MKKIAIIASLLFFTACATPTTPGDLTDKAREIQGYTKLACKFIPTVATIAAILTSGASAPVAVIANDICTAVTTAPLADGGKRIIFVRGVEVKGKFIR